MPESSLQRIEDKYIDRGFKGDQLRKALEQDEEYQKILAGRKAKLTKKFKVTPEEEKKYVLSVDEDYEILGKVKELEKKDLSDEDNRFVQFIRTQLEWDWREPFLKTLDSLLEKYQK